MGENIRDIKRRIKSVNNTKQITHAMELVASAKLRKARNKAEARRAYYEEMLSSIRELAAKSGKVKNIYLQQRESKKALYILISGDKGLAGGYNSNVIKSVLTDIEDKDNKASASLITVGSKGRDYFKKRDFSVIGEYTGISEEPTFFDAKEIAETVMSMFKDGIVDEVYLAYTKFVSTISQKPELIKLLPLDCNNLEEVITDENQDIPLVASYEPSIGSLLGYLIPKYISSTILGAMIESAASEQGARRMAMESATENANEMIDVLTLHYNRARQAAITQEITEIVGGAEALK